MKWCTDDNVRVGVIGHGGLLRAFSFARPYKGIWACLGHLPPDMPRRPEIWVSLCNLMLKLRGISRSSAILGSDSPQSNNRKDNSLWVTPFISTAVKRRSQGIPLAIRRPLAPPLRRLWPYTRRLQLLLDDCCRLVLLYHAIQHATDGTDP